MKSPLEFFRKGAGRHSFKGASSFGEHLQQTGRYVSEADVIENFDSLVEEVHDWLEGKSCTQARILMDLMLELNEDKTREDDVTPSALHELTQAIWFISTIEDGVNVDDPEGVLSVIFAHDLGEDYGLSPEYMGDYLLKNGIRESEQLEQFKEDFDVISKRYGKDGELKHTKPYYYYLDIQENKNASVAKMFDRAQNVMTLVGVKDKSKMHDYIAKTLQIQNDFVRDASANFPSQTDLYETLQDIIEQEIQVSRYYTVDTGKKLPNDGDLYLSMPDNGFKNLPLGIHPLLVPAERIRETYPDTHLNSAINSPYTQPEINQNDKDLGGDKNEPVT